MSPTSLALYSLTSINLNRTLKCSALVYIISIYLRESIRTCKPHLQCVVLRVLIWFSRLTISITSNHKITVLVIDLLGSLMASQMLLYFPGLSKKSCFIFRYWSLQNFFRTCSIWVCNFFTGESFTTRNRQKSDLRIFHDLNKYLLQTRRRKQKK